MAGKKKPKEIVGRAAQVRDWIRQNRKYSYTYYADYAQVHPQTMMRFLNHNDNTGIDAIESLLNAMGGTLKVVPLDEDR